MSKYKTTLGLPMCMVQINCAELIYFLLVMKWCYFKIVSIFYFVSIQCIIQPDDEHILYTDKNWSTGIYVKVFTLDGEYSNEEIGALV